MNLSADQLARLRLIRTPSIGPITFRQLVARCGSAADRASAAAHSASRSSTRIRHDTPSTHR